MKRSNPVVIVGMGGCFPEAATPEQYWNLIQTGAAVAREMPVDRTLVPIQSVLQKGEPSADKVTGSHGCFIDHHKLKVDYANLNIDEALVEKLDPLFKLSLYAASQAWQDAAVHASRKPRTGVIIGNIVLPTDHASALARHYLGAALDAAVRETKPSVTPTDLHPWDARPAALPAAVIAQALGLEGSVYTLDAACASSLFALKLAVEELHSGRLDVVISGGLSRPDCLYTQMGFSQLRALSQTGLAAPFDARANGLVVGEGAGLFVLKRLRDAQADGDRIYAVIEGIGLSNDTDGSLLAPSSEGQLRAMRAAYAEAQWPVEAADLIECHATGTPLGDQVEFNSLRTLWQASEAKPQSCVIGSVKGTIGHLLTAAGSASLMKVILAMQAEQLPPTSNFDAPAPQIDLVNSPFRVLQRPEPWHKRQGARRAAVSAFGFGGTNAHLLLSQYESELWPACPDVHEVKQDAIAVVGLGASFGPWQGLNAVCQRLMDGTDEASPNLGAWWGLDAPAGFYLPRLELPLGAFRIPPIELAEMLPQQTLLLLVGREALQDAKFQRDNADDCGLFAGIGLDLNTTDYQLRWDLDRRANAWNHDLDLNLSQSALTQWIADLRKAAAPALNANRVLGGLGGLVAHRLAREYRFGGPCLSISSDENSGLKALEAAVGCLSRGELNLALVSAVDFCGDIRNLLSRTPAEGLLDGEGAVALVLKRQADAERDGNTIYGLVRASASASNADGAVVLNMAFERADIDPARLSFLETPATRVMPDALVDTLQKHGAVLSDVATDIGHCGAALGLAAVLKSLLALHHRILPAHRLAPLNFPDPLGYQIPGKTRLWLRDRIQGPRIAAVVNSALGQTSAVVLEGYDACASKRNPMVPLAITLFPLHADSREGLIQLLGQLSDMQHAHGDGGFPMLARGWWQLQRDVTANHHLILAPDSQADLVQYINIAKIALAGPAPAKNAEFAALLKKGKLFWRAQPLGADAPVAFVYPGSGNHFHGMGRALALRWPESFQLQDSRTQYLADELRPDLFWGEKEPSQLGKQFRELLSAQVSLGIAMHDTLSRFGVTPQAAIGYSLGESACLFATGAWRDHDEMHLRTKHSDLFQTQLANQCEAVRRFWNLPEDEAVDWVVGVVIRGADEVRSHLPRHPHTYLLIANTPRESVLGGNRAALKALVEEMGARFFQLEGIVSVHCEVLTPVAERYRDHHLFETHPPIGVRFYSGARGDSYELNRESAAEAILEQAQHGIDFPKTIRQAYADGLRCFVEIGPGASCTRMIREILKGERFFGAALTRHADGAEAYFLRALAGLMAEGIRVNLDPLFADLIEAKPQKQRTIAVPIGGQPFQIKRPARSDAPKSVETNATHIPVNPALAASASLAKNATATTMSPRPEPQPKPKTMPTEEPLRHADRLNHQPDSARIAHDWSDIVERQTALVAAQQAAHEAYLTYAQTAQSTLAAAISHQTSMIGALLSGGASETGQPTPVSLQTDAKAKSTGSTPVMTAAALQPAATAQSSAPAANFFDRDACLEFARGSIGRMLGERFAEIDSFPTRVRLPDEPLMLVDRILDVGGERMGHGFVVTEHDVLANAWYLDSGRIATCVAIEAGQADLFLGAWLGVDFETKGRSVYRLLDAKVTFHRALPVVGDVIRYDIFIDSFFRQGDTHFFRFRFDGTVNGERLLTMREGVAGFFSAYELESGKGIVRRHKDRALARRNDWLDLVGVGIERYDRPQLDALRRGDLVTAFGDAFAGLPLRQVHSLPTGLMDLVDRVTLLDPAGGEYGLGLITAEMDIHPDDWFLTCHFVGDEVMPGTLMYECCLHTLRIFLMRHGWVGEQDELVCQPILGVASKLLCRGQVLKHTRTVTYEVHVRELGFAPEPYCIADAYMYSDAKCIVDISDMCVRFTGLSREKLQKTWQGRVAATPELAPASTLVMDYASILALANGNPSQFGDRYLPFDEERVIARFPRPPFLFMSRVERASVQPWILESGGTAEVCYDIPGDAWYFAADRQPVMPYAVLLEIALQSCGWTAAYMGCALLSPDRLLFRNLGGNATQYIPITADTGTLTTHVKVTSVSKTKEVILLFFEYAVTSAHGIVYEGDTYFGFFSETAMANQVGVSDHQWYAPTEQELLRGESFVYPSASPYPSAQMRMLDTIDLYLETGGAYGIGYIEGSLQVVPDLWFFEAHFYQDPVWPGSLGLEAFQQLLKVFAGRYFQVEEDSIFQSVNLDNRHTWVYRGQVLPSNKRVQVQANIREIDEETQTILADGYLMVDGMVIYQIQNYGLSIQ